MSKTPKIKRRWIKQEKQIVYLIYRKGLIIDDHIKLEDVGRMVVYQSFDKKEDGRITSWNDKYIFVDFDNTSRGQACRPSDLEFTYGGNK